MTYEQSSAVIAFAPLLGLEITKTLANDFIEFLLDYHGRQLAVQIACLNAMILVLKSTYPLNDTICIRMLKAVFPRCSHPDLEDAAYKVIALLLSNPVALKVFYGMSKSRHQLAKATGLPS